MTDRSERYDLAIEGGEVFSTGTRTTANLYISNGRIAEITKDRRPARELVDASSLFVMPGMVDTHVHLMDPSETLREDFPTGTAAAARAGVTTIIEHTHSGPIRTPDQLHEKRAYLAPRARVDFGLAAHAWPSEADQISALWRAGVSFFKAFTCTTHGIPGHSPAQLQSLFREVAAIGAICLVHCEDESIVSEMERALKTAGRTDPTLLTEWRSREAEIVAISTASLLARVTHARAVIAHVSNAQALEFVLRDRRSGANVRAETCPQYLTLMEDEVGAHGPLRKFTPPARAKLTADLDAMWEALRSGSIDFISSDHAPSTLEQKLKGSIWEAPFGLPGLDTTLAILLDGAHSGRITYERISQVYSEVPARTYGLWPRKGQLAVGCDADIVLIDPRAEWTVRNEDIISKAGWSPFEGHHLRGRPVRTYVRGILAAESGTVTAAPGLGRFLPGPGATMSKRKTTL